MCFISSQLSVFTSQSRDPGSVEDSCVCTGDRVPYWPAVKPGPLQVLWRWAQAWMGSHRSVSTCEGPEQHLCECPFSLALAASGVLRRPPRLLLRPQRIQMNAVLLSEEICKSSWHSSRMCRGCLSKTIWKRHAVVDKKW